MNEAEVLRFFPEADLVAFAIPCVRLEVQWAFARLFQAGRKITKDLNHKKIRESVFNKSIPQPEAGFTEVAPLPKVNRRHLFLHFR